MKNLKPYVWLVALALSAAAPAQTKIALTEPKVSAASAIAIDAESGKILWQKNADASRFPASTTKIMTAMLLIENCTADEVIVAPPDIEKVGESSMHLKPGERITAADMLYALMLRSANDGCVAVADHIAGSVPKFVEMMNAKAKALGCTNTHFDNPNGLNDPKHTTTAHDLALIARAAMRYPIFEQVVRTTKHVIKRDPKISRDDLMFNHDKLLMKDPSADGIKTGWTIPAGRCFVGSATRDGYRVITVVLKSQDWQKDDQILLNWAFADHNREYAFRPGQMLGPLPVEGGTSPSCAGLRPGSHLAQGRREEPASQVRSSRRSDGTGEEGAEAGAGGADRRGRFHPGCRSARRPGGQADRRGPYRRQGGSDSELRLYRRLPHTWGILYACENQKAIPPLQGDPARLSLGHARRRIKEGQRPRTIGFMSGSRVPVCAAAARPRS